MHPLGPAEPESVYLGEVEGCYVGGRGLTKISEKKLKSQKEASKEGGITDK